MSPVCRNCGQPAGPEYCGHCGQALADRRAPVLALLGEAASEWLSLDTKLLRTLRALCAPGRLTALYLEGRRASFVPPLRLYLIASLLLFFQFSLQAPDASSLDIFINGQLVGERAESAEREDLNIEFDAGETVDRLLGSRVADKQRQLRQMAPQELLDRLYASAEKNVPRALILFIPFLALGLKGLYWRGGALYFDHLIMALHFQSALFLLLLLAWLLNFLGLDRLVPGVATYGALGFLGGLAYLAVALRTVYRQSWPLTIAKTGLLVAIYLVILQLVGGVTVALVLAQT